MYTFAETIKYVGVSIGGGWKDFFRCLHAKPGIFISVQNRGPNTPFRTAFKSAFIRVLEEEGITQSGLMQALVKHQRLDLYAKLRDGRIPDDFDYRSIEEMTPIDSLTEQELEYYTSIIGKDSKFLCRLCGLSEELIHDMDVDRKRGEFPQHLALRACLMFCTKEEILQNIRNV